MPGPSRLKTNAKMGGVVVGAVMAFEGLSLVAYRDPVGIPTACFGETRGIHLGDKFTRERCKDMLDDRLIEFERGVRSCLTAPDKLPDGAYAASISFAYNLGVGAYCNSSIVRLFNSGQVLTGCDKFLLYDKATVGGVKVYLPGLAKRRQAEREMCRKVVL